MPIRNNLIVPFKKQDCNAFVQEPEMERHAAYSKLTEADTRLIVLFPKDLPVAIQFRPSISLFNDQDDQGS